MEAHDRDVLPAIDALHRGVSVEIVAHFPWKWPAIAHRVASHYESRGWHVLQVDGDAAVRNVPFFSIGLAGVGGSETRSPTFTSALQDLGTRFSTHSGLIVMVEANQVDSQSRAVLVHASRRWRVPLLVLRTLDPDGDDNRALPGAFSYELAPVTPEEFRSALEARLLTTVDHLAAVRLFTSVGGDLDLGVSILEAGLWEGTFDRQNDVVGIRSWRWCAGYRRPVAAALEHLDSRARAALTSLALAGPIPVDLARKHAPEDVLARLQAGNHIAIVEDGAQACVLVTPPIVADCLRRTAVWPSATGSPASDVAGRGGDAPAPRLALAAPSSQVRAAQLIGLAEERSRHELFGAEAAWSAQRDIDTAVRLLAATIAAGVSVDDSLWSALDEPSFIPDLGDAAAPRAAIDAQAMRWTIHARDHGDCTEAVARLRDLASTAPLPTRAYLLTRVARLEQAFCLTADATELAEIAIGADLPGWANDGLWLAVAGRSLCRGNLAVAMDALGNIRGAEAFEEEFHTLGCLVAVALFRADEAAVRRRLVQLHALAESSGSLVALHVSAAYHAGVSVAGYTGPEFEVPRQLGIQLGLPLERGPAGLLGATFSAASFNAFDPWLGFLVTTYDMRAGREGLSPGCSLLVDGWAGAHDLLVAGNVDAAAEAMLTLGDRLRELGAEQAALQAYLLAGEFAVPESDVLIRIQESLAQFELELVALYRDHPVPTGEDGHLWRNIAESFEDAGLTGAAVRVWKRAISAHRRSGDDKARQAAEGRLDELFQIRWTAEGVLHSPADQQLTAREREIAVLVATGMSNRDIATALSLSVRTIEAHTNRIFRKTGVSGRREVAAYLLHHPGSARMRRIG